jgi:hypothetical protein
LLCQGAPGAKLADARDALTVYDVPVSPVALPARVIHATAMEEVLRGRRLPKLILTARPRLKPRPFFNWLAQQGFV